MSLISGSSSLAAALEVFVADALFLVSFTLAAALLGSEVVEDCCVTGWGCN